MIFSSFSEMDSSSSSPSSPCVCVSSSFHEKPEEIQNPRSRKVSVSSSLPPLIDEDQRFSPLSRVHHRDRQIVDESGVKKEEDCAAGMADHSDASSTSSSSQADIVTGAVGGPQPYDVLLGRGRAVRKHPGNRRFEEIIRKHLQTYEDVTLREHKTIIAERIVKVILNKGQFLKQESENSWKPVDPKFARDKVIHALSYQRRKKQGKHQENRAESQKMEDQSGVSFVRRTVDRRNSFPAHSFVSRPAPMVDRRTSMPVLDSSASFPCGRQLDTTVARSASLHNNNMMYGGANNHDMRKLPPFHRRGTEAASPRDKGPVRMVWDWATEPPEEQDIEEANDSNWSVRVPSLPVQQQQQQQQPQQQQVDETTEPLPFSVPSFQDSFASREECLDLLQPLFEAENPNRAPGGNNAYHLGEHLAGGTITDNRDETPADEFQPLSWRY